MTTAHNIVPAPGPAFVRPSGGGGPTVRTKPWPEWAMLRAEEVRAKLPPEQWGPWNHQGPCLVSNNTTGSSQMQPHPTEAPHFFYCRAHLQAIGARTPTVRPWPARDKGRCCSCGDAAEPLPVTMADPVACVEAERTNSTVARLKTKRYCAGCNRDCVQFWPSAGIVKKPSQQRAGQRVKEHPQEKRGPRWKGHVEP